jgi:hypothetical protein
MQNDPLIVNHIYYLKLYYILYINLLYLRPFLIILLVILFII